jgi:hypothetical protein
VLFRGRVQGPKNGVSVSPTLHGDEPSTLYSGANECPPSVDSETWWLGSEGLCGEVWLQK